MCAFFFFLSSRRRHTRCALVTGVQTCALPIWRRCGLRVFLDARADAGPQVLRRRVVAAQRPQRSAPVVGLGSVVLVVDVHACSTSRVRSRPRPRFNCAFVVPMAMLFPVAISSVCQAYTSYTHSTAQAPGGRGW